MNIAASWLLLHRGFVLSAFHKIHVESSDVSGEACGELTFLCNGDRICTQEKKMDIIIM